MISQKSTTLSKFEYVDEDENKKIQEQNHKNIHICKKNLIKTLDDPFYANDCSSKTASFNPSKLPSPNFFLSNLKFRLKYYGCNDTLSHDILSI
jgi:hypothetical protein